MSKSIIIEQNGIAGVITVDALRLKNRVAAQRTGCQRTEKTSLSYRSAAAAHTRG